MSMIPTRNDFAWAATSPSGCGFTDQQIRVLGMDPRKEWLNPLIGTYIPDEVWTAFVACGDTLRARNYKRANRDLSEGPKRKFWSDAKPPKDPDSQQMPPHPSRFKQSLPKTAFVEPSLKKELFESEDWKFLRAYALRRDNYTCQHCGTRNVRLHVDHKIPITVDWSRRLDLLNLQVLCEDCNVGKSNFFVG